MTSLFTSDDSIAFSNLQTLKDETNTKQSRLILKFLPSNAHTYDLWARNFSFSSSFPSKGNSLQDTRLIYVFITFVHERDYQSPEDHTRDILKFSRNEISTFDPRFRYFFPFSMHPKRDGRKIRSKNVYRLFLRFINVMKKSY